MNAQVNTAANSADNTTTTLSGNVKRFALKPMVMSLAMVMAISGCSSIPQQLTKNEVQARAEKDYESIKNFEAKDPIEGPLTLEVAVARALKNNLDYRVRKMESALALGVADYSKRDMWPSLLANAGYNNRSNFSGGTSIGIEDGVQSLRASTGQERQYTDSGVSFSWNILDFGVSYWMSKQNADKFLIAEEQRRKQVQHIVQDVRAAYWRALGAQKLEGEAKKILNIAENAMVKSREAEAQKIIAPDVALNFQRAILDATMQLNHHRQSLVIAKHELAGLMSLPPEVEFELAAAEHVALPTAPKDIPLLEEMALLQRPELRITDLEKRITAAESKKEVLHLFPNLNFTTAFQTTSNAYAFNKNWMQSSLGISWNIMKLFSIGQQKENRIKREKVDEAKRLALNIAVIAQVRMAAESYTMAMKDYDLAQKSADVNEKLSQYAADSATAKLQNQLEVIRTKTQALLGEYQRTHAYANAQIAFGRLYSSLGFDPLADGFDKYSIAELTDKVKQHFNDAERDSLKMKSNLFGKNYKFVNVKITGIDDPVLKTQMRTKLLGMLERNNIHHSRQGSPLTFALVKDTYLNMDKANWTIELQNEDGLVVNTGEFATTIPHGSRDSIMEATLTAAASANLNEMQAWLKHKPVMQDANPAVPGETPTLAIPDRAITTSDTVLPN